MKKKRIEIPIYRGDLVLIEAPSLSEMEGKLNLTFSESIRDYDAFTFTDGERYLEHYMCFEEGVALSVVAHEAVHVAHAIFKDMSIKLDIDNDEPYAYLLGWIVEQVCEFLEIKP